MNGPLRTAVTGALAGSAATLPMSAVLFASQRARFIGKLPPEKITETALDAAEVPRTEGEEDVLSSLAHLGFGATCGVIFAALERGRLRPASAVAAGALFGTAVWAVSYGGWVPALRILPPIHRDAPGRQGTMLVAHWVFGGLLGALLSVRRRR